MSTEATEQIVGNKRTVGDQTNESISKKERKAVPLNTTNDATVAEAPAYTLSDKIDYRILAKPGPDICLILGGEQRIVPSIMFNEFVKPGPFKKDAFYMNFEARAFEKATGIRFRNANTPQGLTIESPLMKVKYGLHDTESYPGSYSMKLDLVPHAYDVENKVDPFVTFLEDTDNLIRQYIIANAFEWLKDIDSCKSHPIVDRHRETKNAIFANSWKKGEYDQQKYEAEFNDCFEGAIRSDGGGKAFHVKVSPVMNGKDKAIPVRPDIVLFKNGSTPVPYSPALEIAKNGQCYVQCVLNLNRISFTKNKFYVSWSCGVANFVPESDLQPETAGQQEISYQFDGSTTAVKIPIHHRNTDQPE